MADVKWIKIATDIFDDEKILMIESMPAADSIITVWFKLLALAGKQNNSGVFMMNDRIAYTDEMLAAIFRRDLTTVRLAINTFEQFGMIEIVDNVITIPNWGKHQRLDAYENKKLYDREYQAKRREQQKQIVDSRTIDSTNDSTNNRSESAYKNKNKNKNKNKIENKNKNNTLYTDELNNKKELNTQYKGNYNNLFTASEPSDEGRPRKKKTDPVRHKYGEYKNVLLSDEELEKLKSEFPEDWEKRIEDLSFGIKSYGYKYKDHLATIRNWARRDAAKNQQKAAAGQNQKRNAWLDEMIAAEENGEIIEGEGSFID